MRRRSADGGAPGAQEAHLTRLLAEVRELNRVVARIAGALYDAVGESAPTAGAIVEHPKFEELETRGRSETDKGH